MTGHAAVRGRGAVRRRQSEALKRASPAAQPSRERKTARTSVGAASRNSFDLCAVLRDFFFFFFFFFFFSQQDFFRVFLCCFCLSFCFQSSF
jgi:hypothetical protein